MLHAVYTNRENEGAWESPSAGFQPPYPPHRIRFRRYCPGPHIFAHSRRLNSPTHSLCCSHFASYCPFNSLRPSILMCSNFLPPSFHCYLPELTWCILWSFGFFLHSQSFNFPARGGWKWQRCQPALWREQQPRTNPVRAGYAQAGRDWVGCCLGWEEREGLRWWDK